MRFTTCPRDDISEFLRKLFTSEMHCHGRSEVSNRTWLICLVRHVHCLQQNLAAQLVKVAENQTTVDF